MQVDYRPVGKKHRVVGVLETIDGKPAREISIRKYIRMLKKQSAAPKDPLAPRLKPLKNILREYLQSNPEYADRLRLQNGKERGAIQVTDGKFVLKQLSVDELRELIAKNEQFVNVITYRQIARQTGNFMAFGTTASPAEVTQAPAKRDIETPILAQGSGARYWFNHHALVAGAGALVILLAAVTFAVVRTRGRMVPLPAANLQDGASVELMIQRCEAAVRGYMTQVVEDPTGARDGMTQTRRSLAEVKKANLTPAQSKRVEAIQYRLDRLEGAADAVQSK